MSFAEHIADDLVDLGVSGDGVLVVHTAFSAFAGRAGTPADLIAGLRMAAGPHGTVVMPSMSDDDDHPFDRRATPCLGMGVLAETFWRTRGVLRSDSPHAFAAIGPHAASITADHPIDVPHGLNSPVGRVYELDGQILMLGVGHDANTTVHLAEALEGVRYHRQKFATIMQGGQAVRCCYNEIDHCCDKFTLVDQWLDAEERQRRGRVGHGEARLAGSREVVEVVRARLRADETVFLHEPGVDIECDEARASIGNQPAV